MGTINELIEARGRPLVMGIVNVTPDSFYPASRRPEAKQAIAHGIELAGQGADVLDVGGESTRPGSSSVAPDEELSRVLPVVEGLVDNIDVPVSVDTRRASVAEACLDAGAVVVNDISAGRDDERQVEVVRDHGADLVLMHMQGRPATMQQDPSYADVVAEVEAFLLERSRAAQAAGVPADAITLDPGLGFGKRLGHNLSLVRATARLASHGHPLLIGASRKSMFQMLLDRPLERRLAGSLAVAAYTALHGAGVLRVHDVRETRDVLDTLLALEEGPL